VGGGGKGGGKWVWVQQEKREEKKKNVMNMNKNWLYIIQNDRGHGRATDAKKGGKGGKPYFPYPRCLSLRPLSSSTSLLPARAFCAHLGSGGPLFRRIRRAAPRFIFPVPCRLTAAEANQIPYLWPPLRNHISIEIGPAGPRSTTMRSSKRLHKIKLRSARGPC